MAGKRYRAVTLVAPDVGSRALLMQAFNAWVEEEQPSDILHMHYYHDPESHVRGYQIVYEESWHAAEHLEPPEVIVGPRFSV
jgi:hypothetical protein